MFSIEYLRTFRLGEYAIFDIASAFLGVFLLSPLLTRIFRLVNLEIPLVSWMLLTLPLGLLTHIIIGKETLMTKYLLDPSSHYLLKICIFGLLISGLKNITLARP